MKICSRCEIDQPDSNFCKSARNKSGLNSHCRDCQAKRLRKERYGIDDVKFQELLKTHNNSCALCFVGPEGTLCVDHNHRTGGIRGILCWQCNAALGKLGDNLQGIMKVVRYLKGVGKR